jgi:hypothetical protein|tara:strand:+ start:7956 stop:9344 length:1389 start_codon:yes stop_codon:yes gene_type:complete
MINRFSQFLVEEEKTAFFTMGRFNPPTMGHGMLLDKVSKAAGKNPYKIFVSQSNDTRKNPLGYKDKIKFVRKMFPKHARSVMMDTSVKTPIDAAVKLYNEGYKSVVMMADADRTREYEILLNRYNGKEARHGFYNFKSMKFVSVGGRDPNAKGVEGVSATKQRNAAKENDFTTFAQGLPKNVSNKDAKELFNAVRKGMGLKEQNEFKRHVQLNSVSETREAFVSGSLFTEGEEVVIKKTDMVGRISVLGSNYVIVETSEGKTRQWLEAVEKIVPDYGTPESTAKAKKMTPGQDEACWDGYKQVGMKPKGGKMVPNCVSEYGGPKISRKTYLKQDPMKEKSTQDPDIKDREGTQPKRYHSGLKTATKVARDRHFKKHGKKADDDSSAYKPAPGDKTAKTKPSKYTKAVNKMMEEDAVQMARKRIDREKDIEKRSDDAKEVRHDRILDKARRARMLRKNKGINP